jgi:geranylgeranyl transferase type-2 subunit alpha
MHGKKRSEYKSRLKDPKTAAGLAQKAQQWHALVQELAQRRQNEEESSETTMALIEKALLVNPDPTSLWNHRREELLKGSSSDSDDKSLLLTLLTTELSMTQASLQRSPKAYGAWFHRKWILQHVKPSVDVLQTELALTATFLLLDERNFHCWNFRRFVVAALAGSWNGEWTAPPMGPQVAKETEEETTTSSSIIPNELIRSEWKFTRDKIQDNFSNFSAFHYRSQLLPLILKQQESVPQDLMDQELQLIEDAICTEPDDQTAWWYHALLLDSILPSEQLTSRLEQQADLLRELLEESPGKWVLLGLHRVLSVLQINQDEQSQLLQQLIQVDPDRAQRYQELLLG